jgi:hypothetical protein
MQYLLCATLAPNFRSSNLNIAPDHHVLSFPVHLPDLTLIFVQFLWHVLI